MALPGTRAQLAPSKPTPVGSLLVSAASAPQELQNDTHWTGGIRWNPEAVKSGQIDFFDTGTNEALALSDAPVMPFETPYVVEDGYRLSATGNQYVEEDGQAKALNALLRNQSRLIELEFWEGKKARNVSLNNFFLANNGSNLASDTTKQAPSKATDLATGFGGTPGTTSYKIRKAFGGLEEVTVNALGGGPCMIHVPVRVVPYLANAQLVTQVGPLLLTKMGNIVVAGYGYTGVAPGLTGTGDGSPDTTYDTAYMYGTDIVILILDTAYPQAGVKESISDSSGNIQNTVNFRANRFAITLVNHTVNYAVKVDLANS